MQAQVFQVRVQKPIFPPATKSVAPLAPARETESTTTTTNNDDNDNNDHHTNNDNNDNSSTITNNMIAETVCWLKRQNGRRETF